MAASGFFKSALSGHSKRETRFVIPDYIGNSVGNGVTLAIEAFMEFVRENKTTKLSDVKGIHNVLVIHSVFKFLQAEDLIKQIDNALTNCIATEFNGVKCRTSKSVEVLSKEEMQYVFANFNKRTVNLLIYLARIDGDECYFPEEYKIIWEYKKI